MATLNIETASQTKTWVQACLNTENCEIESLRGDVSFIESPSQPSTQIEVDNMWFREFVPRNFNGDSISNLWVFIDNTAKLRKRPIVSSGGGGSSITGKDIVDAFRKEGVIGLFNKLKVATTKKEFDNQLSNDRQPLFWDEKIIGGAISSLDTNNSALDLTVSNDGDRFIRQMKQYTLYQSGNAKGCDMTYTPDINTNEVSFVLRSSSGAFNGSTAGIPFDLEIPQSSWSIDKLDGTGESGILLDKTNSNIFVMNLEWLSVGTILYGFEINGKLILCHSQNNANTIKGAYMTTANLPARYEILSEVSGSSQYVGYGDDGNGVFVKYKSPNQSATLKQICTNVYSEGGDASPLGIPFNPATGTNRVTLTAGSTIVLGARPLLTYQGLDNLTIPALTNRTQLIPDSYFVGSTESDVFAEVLYNGNVIGGTWIQYEEGGNYSATEINQTPIGVANGLRIDSKTVYASAGGFFGGGSKEGKRTMLASKLPFGIGIDADTPITLSLRITNIGGATTEIDYDVKWLQI